MRTMLIKRIHVLKRELNLDEELYRTMLHSVSGKKSCSEMEIEELNLVKLSLERLASGKQSGTETRTKNSQMQNKIAKLGYLLGWTWPHISDFCKVQTGRRSTRECNAQQLTKVINGMIAIINDRLQKNELQLSDDDLRSFLRYTQQQSKRQKEE